MPVFRAPFAQHFGAATPNALISVISGESDPELGFWAGVSPAKSLSGCEEIVVEIDSHNSTITTLDTPPEVKMIPSHSSARE